MEIDIGDLLSDSLLEYCEFDTEEVAIEDGDRDGE